MKDKTPQPLRGDAAWRAAKDEINKRNDAARARGAAQRAERDARTAEQRLAAERQEASNLPEQPHP
jgi:hypothetical protein